MSLKFQINPITGQLDITSERSDSEGSGVIGIPSDGSYLDGLFPFTPDTPISEAIDEINEILTYLVPQPPLSLGTQLNYDVTLKSGFIANYSNLGSLTAGSSINSIIDITNIHGVTMNTTRFNKADKGTIELLDHNYNIIDSISLETNFNESERDTIQSYPPLTSTNGYLTILSVECYNNFPNYQKGQVRVNFQGLLSEGYNAFYLRHNIPNEIQDTDLQIIYLDQGDEITGETESSFDINESSIYSLSGINYINENNDIIIDVLLHQLFNKTYIETPVRIFGDCLNTLNINWNDSNAFGFSTPPNYNDNWQYSNTIQPNLHALGKNLNFTVQASNVCRNIEFTKTLNNYLHLMLPTSSTDLIEYFQDEVYRIPLNHADYNYFSSITGLWNSSDILSNGNAQVFPGKLIYPQENFNIYTHPSQQSGVDYSSFSGDQTYIRAIRNNNIAMSNGSLVIDGISFDDLLTNVSIYIRLPGQTGWLDLGTYYSSSSFTGTDGDGCLISYQDISTGVILNWTVGTFSTVNSQYLYLIKIIFHQVSIEIQKIEETYNN